MAEHSPKILASGDKATVKIQSAFVTLACAHLTLTIGK